MGLEEDWAAITKRQKDPGHITELTAALVNAMLRIDMDPGGLASLFLVCGRILSEHDYPCTVRMVDEFHELLLKRGPTKKEGQRA